ncbi:uncharacterized protein C6orf118-like [Strongylocentrotus purpuratus]|uniref:Translin-associated factor X-interacting protein 1 N-terminal domain-containing protein n=1 Tax=Strongylocentrotus purpuratus TaxID=7668 RepID=A0A7M7SSQ5_STRPU|nr:uncharacterized protein C6orf118-like [Strongylocentrotus purpuratus]|eukprot:XP_003726397.1 PREDICTED: uncharacterized protein C6orf118 [Strongylocentrotus purpuratus]
MASEQEGPDGPLPPPGVSSRPLRDVMEGLFQEQKYDILLRTKGHLNHNRLSKPPEMATHKPWESSGKEVPLLLAPSKLPSPRRAQSKEEEMVQALYHFSTGTAGSLPHPTPADLRTDQRTTKASAGSHHGSRAQPQRASNLDARMDSPASYIDDGVCVEELSLPEIMLPVSRQKTTRGISRTQSPPHRLPPFDKREDRSAGGRDLHKQQFVQSHLAGITKRDQLNRFLDFQKNVLRKEEMYEKGVLTGRKAVAHLERKLYEKLQELNVEARFSAPNFHRLQIYSDIWDELIEETPTFAKVLLEVKGEFDLYMGLLLDTQPHKHGEILSQQVRGLTASGVVLPGELAIGQDVVKKMEQETKNLLEENDRLRETLRKEEHAVAKLPPLIGLPDPIAARVKAKEEEIVLGQGDQVLEHHNKILDLQGEIEALTEDLHEHHVPRSICDHMEGCLRDTEAEVLKLLSTNEYLAKTIQGLSVDVDKLLERYDAPDTDIRAIWKSINTIGAMTFPGVY